MERFVALYPLVILVALVLMLVSAGWIAVPATIGAMAMPALLIAGVVLVVGLAVRSR
jgi:hypothetical protein